VKVRVRMEMMLSSMGHSGAIRSSVKSVARQRSASTTRTARLLTNDYGRCKSYRAERLGIFGTVDFGEVR
jgi:hypothetical protein